jgi:predicted NAD-dependent protein-ADP-ribosyltransferase YbiA (DUF1768 family)
MTKAQSDYFEGLSLAVAYNNYSNNQDSAICNLIQNLLSDKVILRRIVKIESEEKLGMHFKYPFKFRGFSVLEIVGDVHESGLQHRTFDYVSIYQYITHQKAMLFLDFRSGIEILRTVEQEKLILLDKNISNYNNFIWREYAFRIIMQGLKKMIQESKQFNEHIDSTIAGVFYSIGTDEIWDVQSTDVDLEQHLTPKSTDNMNAYGKLLTLLKVKEI